MRHVVALYIPPSMTFSNIPPSNFEPMGVPDYGDETMDAFALDFPAMAERSPPVEECPVEAECPAEAESPPVVASPMRTQSGQKAPTTTRKKPAAKKKKNSNAITG